jgi:hypothetical protein
MCGLPIERMLLTERRVCLRLSPCKKATRPTTTVWSKADQRQCEQEVKP